MKQFTGSSANTHYDVSFHDIRKTPEIIPLHWTLHRVIKIILGIQFDSKSLHTSNIYKFMDLSQKKILRFL